MAVRHINPYSKAQSGVILSGKEAVKVFSLFNESNRNEKYIKRKKSNFHSRLKALIQTS